MFALLAVINKRKRIVRNFSLFLGNEKGTESVQKTCSAGSQISLVTVNASEIIRSRSFFNFIVEKVLWSSLAERISPRVSEIH